MSDQPISSMSRSTLRKVEIWSVKFEAHQEFGSKWIFIQYSQYQVNCLMSL